MHTPDIQANWFNSIPFDRRLTKRVSFFCYSDMTSWVTGKITCVRRPLCMTRERLNKNSFRIKNACLKMTFRLLPWHPSLHYSHKMPIKGIQEEHIKEKVLKGGTIIRPSSKLILLYNFYKAEKRLSLSHTDRLPLISHSHLLPCHIGSVVSTEQS